MKLGIDVSENNGYVNWQAVKDAGVEFAIVRSSYGKYSHDDMFLQNVNGAHSVGLLCGAYHYSYALNEYEAELEAHNCRNAIAEAGVLLELPVAWDFEDADGFKARNDFAFDYNQNTAMAKAFLDNLGLHGFLYASYSWLQNYIDWRALGCAVWNAQWLSGYNPDVFNRLNENMLPAYMWQYTDKLIIDGKQFDGNVMYA